MNRFFCGLALLLTQTLIVEAQSLSLPDIEAVLAKIRDRRAAAPHVQADFREEKTIHLMTRPIVSTGKVWLEPPNRFRREVRGNSPSLTVCNGRELWIYYPNFKTAEHYELGKRSPLDAAIATINTALNLEDVEKTFQITGTRSADGYQFHLLPRSAAMKRSFQFFDLWLNQDLFVTRTEMSQPNGDRIVTMYSNQSRAAIPAAMFQFTPPAGTDISNPLGK
jgi:outer membrane lipoprotein-sorting protein